jgi:uncharacterized RDD family membrane protein YckC
MKCPKCQYLGFDGQSRCRHCGYDLSLASTTEIQGDAGAMAAPGQPDEPHELTFRPEPSARAQARAAIQKRAATRTPQPDAFDLPLFAQSGVDDRPALPTSRPPLSVRRTPSDAPRARAAAAAAFAPAPVVDDTAAEDRSPTFIESDPAHEAPALALQLDTPVDRHLAGGTLALSGQGAALSIGIARAPDAMPPPSARRPLINDDRPSRSRGVVVAPHAAAPADTPAAPVDMPAAEPEPEASVVADRRVAPLGARMIGGLIDLAMLAVVDAAVVLATLNATGLSWAQVSRLPLAPLAVFLVLLAVGYLAMCTVLAGRTFGQSLLGLAVVETGGRPVRLAPAVVRAAIQVLTVPAAGLGFLPALLGADRRALYDRLAGTDVVRDPRVSDLPSE